MPVNKIAPKGRASLSSTGRPLAIQLRAAIMSLTQREKSGLRRYGLAPDRASPKVAP